MVVRKRHGSNRRLSLPPGQPVLSRHALPNYCFVFPRTAVEIQHERKPAFVANPNVVRFYNAGQVYWRNPISPEGDRCDPFGVKPGLVREPLLARDSISAG